MFCTRAFIDNHKSLLIWCSLGKYFVAVQVLDVPHVFIWRAIMHSKLSPDRDLNPWLSTTPLPWSETLLCATVLSRAGLSISHGWASPAFFLKDKSVVKAQFRQPRYKGTVTVMVHCPFIFGRPFPCRLSDSISNSDERIVTYYGH